MHRFCHPINPDASMDFDQFWIMAQISAMILEFLWKFLFVLAKKLHKSGLPY
jgi:hypothetical protein